MALDPLYGLLSQQQIEDAKTEAGNMAGLQALAGLLSMSGPQARPIGTGQALGQALMGGYQGYQASMDKTLNDMLKGLQVSKLKREMETDARWQKLLSGDTGTVGQSAFGTGIKPVAMEGISAYPTKTEGIKPVSNISYGPSETTAKQNPLDVLGLTAQQKLVLSTMPTKDAMELIGKQAFSQGSETERAWNTLLTEDPASPKYAAAYAMTFDKTRPVSRPITDPNTGEVLGERIVYESTPVPAWVQKPTYTPKAKVEAKHATEAPATKTTSKVEAPAPADTNYGAGVLLGARGEEYNNMRKQDFQLNKLTSSLNRLKSHINENGLQVGGLGEKGGEQNSLYTDFLMQMKEVQGLGVLNGPDERLMYQQLSNPTQLGTLLKGGGGQDYISGQIKALENKISDERGIINQRLRPAVGKEGKINPNDPFGLRGTK